MVKAMNRTLGVVLLTVTTSLTMGCQGWFDLAESPEDDASGEVSTEQGPALTDHQFEQTQTRLDRGRYLVEGVTRCFMCHSDIDWTQPGPLFHVPLGH